MKGVEEPAGRYRMHCLIQMTGCFATLARDVMDELSLQRFAQLNLIGKSPSFVRALGLIVKYATSEATVLVQGETGTGKEFAARAIHYLGKRYAAPFVPVNCGALLDTLVEAELFGHARGAFTDAKDARSGLIAQAKDGTLFLDDIEAMNFRAQAALLRFLQNGEFRPVGGALVRDAKVRVICSTNIDLNRLVKGNLFRRDLLYRLNVLPLVLPPLRDRTGDVSVLAEEFVARLNTMSHLSPKRIFPRSIEILERHSWPGNVRELEHFIQRQYLLASRNVVEFDSVDHGDVFETPAHDFPPDLPFSEAKAQAVSAFEKAYLTSLLERSKGNITVAARISGKDRSDLGKLLRKHALDKKRFGEGEYR